MHGVDVETNEDGWRDGNGWRDEDLTELPRLAQMTRPDVPDDVRLHLRPPEAFGDECCCGIRALVCDVVVSLPKDVETPLWPHHKSVEARTTCAPPETALFDIKAGCEAMEGGEGIVG